jgi:hypothetical protein
VTLEELSERLDRTYAAQTQADLDAVAADLPAAPPAARRRPTRWSISLIGGSEHAGRFRVAGPMTAISLIGGGSFDLREAEVEGDEIAITTFALIGGCDVTVPEGTDVDASDFALIGGKDVRVHEPVRPGLPLLRIRSFSLIGGLSVRSKSGRWLDADRVPDRLELEE